MTKVFISYSRKDEKEKNKLLEHLGMLRHYGIIDPWSDDRIKAGSDWRMEIEQAMREAQVALLLITPSYLDSDFILAQELPTLLERRQKEGLIVIPIIAKPCVWKRHAWLAQMEVRPRDHTPVWGDRGTHVDEDLTKIAEEVIDIVLPAQSNKGVENSQSNGNIIKTIIGAIIILCVCVGVSILYRGETPGAVESTVQNTSFPTSLPTIAPNSTSSDLSSSTAKAIIDRCRPNCKNVNLSGTDFTGLDLSGVNLREANLTGAKLRQATNLHEADLNGARYNIHTKWPAGFDPFKAGVVWSE